MNNSTFQYIIDKYNITVGSQYLVDIEGMVETISVLDKAGIKHVGAGKDKTGNF